MDDALNESPQRGVTRVEDLPTLFEQVRTRRTSTRALPAGEQPPSPSVPNLDIFRQFIDGELIYYIATNTIRRVPFWRGRVEPTHWGDDRIPIGGDISFPDPFEQVLRHPQDHEAIDIHLGNLEVATAASRFQIQRFAEALLAHASGDPNLGTRPLDHEPDAPLLRDVLAERIQEEGKHRSRLIYKKKQGIQWWEKHGRERSRLPGETGVLQRDVLGYIERKYAPVSMEAALSQLHWGQTIFIDNNALDTEVSFCEPGFRATLRDGWGPTLFGPRWVHEQWTEQLGASMVLGVSTSLALGLGIENLEPEQAAQVIGSPAFATAVQAHCAKVLQDFEHAYPGTGNPVRHLYAELPVADVPFWVKENAPELWAVVLGTFDIDGSEHGTFSPELENVARDALLRPQARLSK